MGQFIDGSWHIQDVNPETPDGEFRRVSSEFLHEISDTSPFKPESNRYHLYVSYACPWAHRTLIVRAIKQLTQHIGVSVVHPYMGPYGWGFESFDGTIPDTIYQSKTLGDIYLKSNPTFSGRVTVPVLWDTHTHQIVNNESSHIIRLFNSAFHALADNRIDLYPAHLQDDINRWNDIVYSDINNGVYKVGFARQQSAYDAHVHRLFETLRDLDAHLANRDFLCGNQITEADIRLFVTLLRFDPVYVGHFKCNIQRIVDFEHLPAYVSRIRHAYDIEDTIRMDHIKHHYYASHPTINPSGIVPAGPIDIH